MFHAPAQRRQRSQSRSRRATNKSHRADARRVGLETLEARVVLAAGTWTALAHTAPTGIGTMELLSDGTVIGTQGKNWYKLTPDTSGSYVNGTWSTMANMNLERLYDATNVLPDGRVFVLGGEYSGPNLTANWTNTGEIYNPVTNTWTSIPNFPQSGFGDDPSMVLPDGRVLVGYLSGPQTYIYDPVANTWSAGPTKLYGDRSDEETWTKLPDGSILSYDIFSNQQHAQRMDPSTMTWIDAGSVPVALSGSDSELGPAELLPDGRVFQIGGNGNTAFYTPSTTPGGTGTWAAGPVLPSGLASNDAAAAMMPNGHVLFSAGTLPGWNAPTHIFEFDPTAPIATSLTDVTPTNPNLSGSVVFPTRMLMLPSGQVLFDYGPNQLYVYTPSGSPQTAWKPTITGVVANGNHFTLTGTQLNGLSAGASYGDDAEMDTNYPIVKLTNGAGKVYYAQTSNWSSTGVATGSTPVSTDFSLSASMPYGTYSLSVIANGIASDPVSFTGGIVGSSADLIVTNSGPNSSTEGNNVTFNLTVTNAGPTNTTGVVLTDTLDPNLQYVSATKSQGTFTQSGGVVTFSLGSVSVGQTVTATVTAQALDAGNYSDSASATSSLSDANPNDNTAAVSVPVADATIVVSAPLTTTSQTLTNQTVATFTHGSGIEPTSAFVATINWGDATTSTGTITKSGSTYSVIASHTYALSGTYTIVTTVVEPTAPPPPPPLPWTPLANLDPATSPGTMELLSDGSVMVEGSDNQSWNKLTPDATGSYVNGTWSTIASMHTPRQFYATNVLPDGRVMVLGGVASDGTFQNTGEIYNPLTNAWTSIANFPESTFGNGRTMLLPDGRVLAGSITGPQSYIYNPTTNTWSNGPTKLYNDPTFKEVWTKLADGSILSYDVTGNPQEAQRLDLSNPDPTQWQWVDAGSVPVSLQSGTADIGCGVLLPDGRVLQIGANSNTAIYTPATPGDGTNGAGSWVAGPVLPNGLIGGQTNNGSLSAAMLPNGHVLFVGGHAVGGTDTTHFFEFDPVAFDANPQNPQASLTEVTPTNAKLGVAGGAQRMLMLPSGQVLALLSGNSGGQLYTYTPTDAPSANWQPTITSVVASGDHYTLTGTQLNGLSAGATYGVGNEMDTNYPIVELAATDGSGKVYFARTSNWSSTGVATGSTPVSTDFALPPTMLYGTYSLTVVANGIASDPVSFTGGAVGPIADLVVTNTGPTSSTEGNTVTYNLTVTNSGPYSTPGVVLTDTLDANLTYVSVTKSQGTSTRSGNFVTFAFGSLGVGQTVTATVTAQASEDGTFSDSASVTASILDPNPSNNLAVATAAVAEPPIVVSSPISTTSKKLNNVSVATFTHANGVEPAGNFIATIDWGDGSTSTGSVSESGSTSTYTVKGSHNYASGSSHTITTTVVEAGSSPNVAMALATTTSTSTQTNATASTTTGQAQPTASFVGPARLTPAAVDQVLDAAPLGRRNSALHASPEAASDDMLDEFFAWN